MSDDPDTWPQDKLLSDVAFTLSVAGRLRREDREIAYALEIERLRARIKELEDWNGGGAP